MNAQEIFDVVAVHLVTQGTRAIDDHGNCRYWDQETGRKCAIGCLIPENIYDPDFEGNSVHELSGAGWADLEAAVLPEDLPAWAISFLARLQETHDSPSCWGLDGFNGRGRGRLLEVARQFKLSTDVLELL